MSPLALMMRSNQSGEIRPRRLYAKIEHTPNPGVEGSENEGKLVFSCIEAVGPHHLALALTIESEGGKVLVYPRSSPMIVAGVVHLGMCSGSTRNESGLSVLLRKNSREILLTGDCGYGHLPLFWSSEVAPQLAGLVVPHHGGTTSGLHGRQMPVPSTAPSKLAYSVGSPNYYKHVRPDVAAEHLAAGWTAEMTRKTAVRRSPFGHVLLCFGAVTPVPCLACTPACTLLPTQ